MLASVSVARTPELAEASGPRGSTWRVVVVAPVLTDVFVDTRPYLATRRTQPLTDLVARLNADEATTGLGEWRSPLDAARSNLSDIDADAGVRHPVVLGHLVRLHGPELRAELAEGGLVERAQRAAERQTGAALSWALADARLTFFDFGVATVRCDLILDAPEHLDRRTLRAAVEAASSDGVLNGTSEILGPLVAGFHEVAGETLDLLPVADPFVARRTQGQPLWAHRLCSCSGEAAAGACDLIPPSQRSQSVTTSYGELTAGDGLSTFIPAAGDAELAIARIADVYELAQAYWASLAEWDARLLVRSSLLSARVREEWQGIGGARAAQAERREVTLLSERIRAHRTAMASLVAYLPPAEAAAWGATATAWRLERIEKALDGKISLVRDTVDESLSEALSRKSDRINDIALAFTVIALSGVAFSAIEFSQADALRRPTTVRVAILVLLVVAVLVGLWRLRRATASAIERIQTRR